MLLSQKAWFWNRIFTLLQTRNSKYHKESDFLLKIFTRRQNLNWNPFNVSDFNKKFNTGQNKHTNLRSKNHVSNYVAPWKRQFLCLLEKQDIKLASLRRIRFWKEFLQRVRFWNKIFTLPQIRNSKTQNNQILCIKVLQRVKNWTKFFETFQILNKKLWNVSTIAKIFTKKSRFELC